jgi:hypothetical protein
MHPTHDGDHGLIFFLVISWACVHEQMNMSKSFLEYSINIDRIFGKYYLTHGTEYLVMWKNILPHVHGWMIFMHENLDYKWKLMNFFMNIGNKCFLQKTKQKKQDGKKLCWFVLKLDTWNAKIIL